jgi:general stress protein 26
MAGLPFGAARSPGAASSIPIRDGDWGSQGVSSHGTAKAAAEPPITATRYATALNEGAMRMTKPDDLAEKLWSALKSDRTMMLGLDGVADGHARPMTAQVDADRSPIWFFCSDDNGLLPLLTIGDRAIATFAAKNHSLFASVHGRLTLDTDPATIDRLWNPFVAAWYEGGRNDPKLRLLRLDAEQAEVWLNENSLFAGVKMLLGIDPKEDYRDKVATVDLD